MGLPEIKPEKQEKPNIVYLHPCIGRDRIGNETGHVYIVFNGGQSGKGGVRGEALPLDEAKDIFPGAIISTSSAICDDCMADLDNY